MRKIKPYFDLPFKVNVTEKKNCFLDKIIHVKKLQLPETVTFNEGYISSVKRSHIISISKKDVDYVTVKIITKISAGWVCIEVMMTWDDFSIAIQKSFDSHKATFFIGMAKGISGVFSYRKNFGTYIPAKDFDFHLQRNGDEENEYLTLAFEKALT